MNRHHPYGRGGFEGGPRRGGHQGSLGPERSHHFSDRGGGPSRGRGGWRGGRGGGGGSYGGYSAPGGYDNGPQGDTGGYGNYELGPQDSYYQNGSYGSGMPEYGGSDQPGSYDQEYGDYEDGPGNYGPGGQGGYGRGGANKRGGGAQRRHIEIPESIIEERIQRERPCRTLFIRNVKYETPSEDVRRLFEEHGEIKTFFDLIANRGMVFVTYYDLRAAERARERLQGSEISGRPIDVHYSLPRDDKNGDKEKNQQLQGTLLVTLRDSPSGQQIDDSEVRRKFIPFGEIREVRQTGERPDQRYVEFFDTRSCEEAHDRLRHQGLQDGLMDIAFASDLDDPRIESPRRGGGGGDRGDRGSDRGGREWDNFGQNRRGGRGRGRGRGWGGGGGGRDDWDQRGSDWGEDRGRPYEDEFGRGPRRGSFENRYNNNNRRGGYSGPPGSGSPMSGPGGPPGYSGGPPPPPPTFSQPPATAPPAAPDDRLEQAKKVQQLLAALKGPAPSAPTPPPAPQAGPPSIPPVPAIPSAAAGMPYYAPPQSAQPPYPGAIPPPGAYGVPPPPPAQTGAPQAPAAGLAGLPPNILALLQQSTQAQPPQASPPSGVQSPYGMPPQPAIPSNALPAAANGQGYQQLMAYLSQKRPQ